MKKSKILLLFIIYCLFLTSVGCGYTTRAYIGPYKTIYIAPFKNKINIASARSNYADYVSYFPLLESKITQAVVNRFILDGSLRVVKEKYADVIIKGELIEYHRGELRYAENNEDVDEYRVTLSVNLGFYNNKTQQLIWQKDSLAGDSTYFTLDSQASQAKSEESALDDAVSDLARRIVEEVVEAW